MQSILTMKFYFQTSNQMKKIIHNLLISSLDTCGCSYCPQHAPANVKFMLGYEDRKSEPKLQQLPRETLTSNPILPTDYKIPQMTVNRSDTTYNQENFPPPAIYVAKDFGNNQSQLEP